MSTDSLSLPNTHTATAHDPELPKVIRRESPAAADSKPRIVPWLGHKIAHAVDAACGTLGITEPIGARVRAEIEAHLKSERPAFIHVERLQDLVEETLIHMDQAQVALAYAKYRARRAALREARSAESTDAAESGGQRELVGDAQMSDLRARVEFAAVGLDLTLDTAALTDRLLRSVSVELSPSERRDTILLNARGLLDLDADSRFFAARILLTYIYEETLPWNIRDGIDALKAAHRDAFLNYIPHGIKIGRLDQRLARFDLDQLADILDPYADLQFDFVGVQTLYDRYLIHERAPDGGKRRLEAPQIFWLRVAMGLAVLETDQREQRAAEFYNLYKTKRACSSTPTLFNSGTRRPQLSSCYLLYCGDSIEDIAETWTRFALLSKWAGGLGCSWSAIRGAGAPIHGTNGESSGVVPFLKVANDIALAVNQGGKRPGALCSYLELWHSDVEDFLDLRKETGDERRRTHNMNTALWIPDLFMKRLQRIAEGSLPKDAAWTLFRSSDVPDLPELSGQAFEQRYHEYEQLAADGAIYGRPVRVLTLWKKMIDALFETGHPWLTWKDPANLRSPQDHAGVIHNSNLCTEITLNTSMGEVAVCNLASVNLDQHFTETNEIDHDRLRATVRTLMRMLDNVIDINFYPVDAARNANLRHRPVGLGVMGLQDALHRMGIPFDSPEAVAFNDEVVEAIAYFAYSASCELAAERGPYPTFKGSKWDRGLLPLDTLARLEKERGRAIEVDRQARQDWDELRQRIASHGMRNSNCLAIAPTATIANLMGCSPSVEPSYKNLHTKSNLSGEFIHLNRRLILDLTKLGLWDEEMRNDLKYFDGSVQAIARIPEALRRVYKTAFEIEPTWILQSAAVRQKWIDQAQSTNLWIADNDARKASFMYREAWQRGLKTTYYLRTLNHSGIDNARRDRDQRSQEVEPASADKLTCSLEARRNGGECEACQ